jgi:Uma2 family endonuclease
MSAITTPPVPVGTTTPPPAQVGLQVLRWTVDQFHRVNATGVFEGRRPLLIRGILLEQGPMNPPHAIALELLVDVMRAAFATGWRVRSQLPLVLGLETDPFPDLALVSGTARGTTAHPTSASLVVEISDTTLKLDMTEKVELYATAKVPEYWVLDLNARQLHVFRDPQPLPLPTELAAITYQIHDTLGPNDSVSPLAAPIASIRVADLLP